jgi:hypothetical protein
LTDILEIAAIVLIASSSAYYLYSIFAGRRVRRDMRRNHDEGIATVRENTAAIREHTEVSRQYLALKN